MQGEWEMDGLIGKLDLYQVCRNSMSAMRLALAIFIASATPGRMHSREKSSVAVNDAKQFHAIITININESAFSI